MPCTASEQDLARWNLGELTVSDVEGASGTALSLWSFLFSRHWRELRYGLCIKGAIYELAFGRRPKLRTHDGYLMVFMSPHSHFHLCYWHTDGESACARAALFGRRAGGAPGTADRGIRFWNSRGDQMLTLFLGQKVFERLFRAFTSGTSQERLCRFGRKRRD